MKISQTVHYAWYRSIFPAAIIICLVVGSAGLTGANAGDLVAGGPQAAAFLSRFLKPDVAYIPDLVGPMLSTIQMSVLGTAIGFALAVLLSFFATSVVTHNRVLTVVVRFVLNIVRTVPTLLLAALCVAVIGIGEATGVVTIAIFTLGVSAQLIYETIETVDFGPIESLDAVGANRVQTALWAVLPQIASSLAGYFFYAFEINVRASTVLGYVGAGGIGVVLSSSLGLFRYDRVSIVVVMIFVLVAIVDMLSDAVRRRLV